MENGYSHQKGVIPGLRWHMPMVLLLTVLVSYFDRMNIAYAIAKIGAEYGWTTKEIGSYGGLLMSIFYIEHWGFRAMFYTLGIAGVLISVTAVWAFLHNTPEEHPKNSKQELDYIQSGMEEEEPPTDTIWQGYRSLFSKGSYWVAILAGITNNMVAFGLLSWLPTFFT